MYVFVFGEQCQVRAIAKKTKKKETYQQYARRTETRYIREEIILRVGLVIGIRTVADCNFSSQGYAQDYNENLQILKYHRVYLVVFNQRENPVYVFPEDCMP